MANFVLFIRLRLMHIGREDGADTFVQVFRSQLLQVHEGTLSIGSAIEDTMNHARALLGDDGSVINDFLLGTPFDAPNPTPTTTMSNVSRQATPVVNQHTQRSSTPLTPALARTQGAPQQLPSAVRAVWHLLPAGEAQVETLFSGEWVVRMLNGSHAGVVYGTTPWRIVSRRHNVEQLPSTQPPSRLGPDQQHNPASTMERIRYRIQVTQVNQRRHSFVEAPANRSASHNGFSAPTNGQGLGVATRVMGEARPVMGGASAGAGAVETGRLTQRVSMQIRRRQTITVMPIDPRSLRGSSYAGPGGTAAPAQPSSRRGSLQHAAPFVQNPVFPTNPTGNAADMRSAAVYRRRGSVPSTLARTQVSSAAPVAEGPSQRPVHAAPFYQSTIQWNPQAWHGAQVPMQVLPTGPGVQPQAIQGPVNTAPGQAIAGQQNFPHETAEDCDSQVSTPPPSYHEATTIRPQQGVPEEQDHVPGYRRDMTMYHAHHAVAVLYAPLDPQLPRAMPSNRPAPQREAPGYFPQMPNEQIVMRATNTSPNAGSDPSNGGPSGS